MRLWFVNSWAWVCFVGLMLIIISAAGFRSTEDLLKIAVRVAGITCGLAIIFFGIWMNARWLIR